MGVELSFVIVNWNGGELLRRCVESIIESPLDVSYEIIVIDNASSDDSLALLRKGRAVALGPRLRVIENSENIGFGRANNQAFALTDAPLLFLLNPDTEVTPGAVNELIAAVRSEEKIGGAGPRLLNEDGSLQVSVWRNPPTAWEMLVTGLRLHRLLPKRLRGELLLSHYWNHDRRRNVPMLSGAAILAKREMIEEVGGFNERFHMYGEDNEWCLRIVRAGWQLIFEPGALVIHHGGHSSQQRWTDLEKLRVQNNAFLLLQRCCLPRRKAIANLIASVALLKMQKTIRKIRGHRVEDVELTLELYVEDLKKTLREKGPRVPIV